MDEIDVEGQIICSVKAARKHDVDDDTFLGVLVLVSETNTQPGSCWAQKKVLVVNKCKQYEQRETQGKTRSKKQSISKQKHFPRISFVKIMRDWLIFSTIIRRDEIKWGP